MLEAVDNAFINLENLHELRDRAVDLLRLIFLNRKALLEESQKDSYERIMQKFQEVLKVGNDTVYPIWSKSF